VRPEPPSESAWTAPLASGLVFGPADPQTLARWWSALGDPLLAELVERGLAGSPSVAEAEARVRESRARRKVARADLLPSIEASGSTSRSHTGDTSGRSVGGVEIPGLALGGGGGDRSLYQAGFDAIWELDVFGGRRRELEAAGADLAASEENLRDARVTLAAEMALAYVDLRALQRRLSLAEANLRAQAETFEIASWRAQAGLTTALDVEQARTSLEQTRAEIPLLRAGVGSAKHRLAVLAGEPPAALDALLADPRPIPTAERELAVGVPAETLRQRPDVRRAERELASATARVGVATADRYPDLSLVGSIGLESTAADALFSSGAGTAAFGTRLVQSILDFGRRSGAVEAQDALREQALARFGATVLAALEEVENALVAFDEEQQRRAALDEAAGAANRATALSRDQYSSGLVDFEAVLASERSLFSLQDQLATSEGEVTANLIRLYKALGGGWSPENGG
jgi:NodT family efflux transporter outer membrane factor (OMF) lipoprotein